jgi:hypothetical protein
LFGSNETVVKRFSRVEDVRRKRIAAMMVSGLVMENAMTALVQALSRASAGTSEASETLKLMALISSAGLLVSVLFAIYGPTLDLSSGFF